ncbi:hypothetical protein [Paenibacillus sp. SI8]|uniref:hypothetical protein n=1 Tax=unclassified Paenibacillus TaxID=185978 RepID=UPI00346630D3
MSSIVVTDISNINSALQGKSGQSVELIFPSGKYTLGSNILITDINVSFKSDGKVEFAGDFGFVFDSAMDTPYPIEDILDGDNFFKFISPLPNPIPYGAGDYVEIAGAISAEYPVARYTFGKAVARVESVKSDGKVILDRQINFNFTKYRAWQPNTSYISGERVYSDTNKVYESLQIGISKDTAPSGNGDSISDGVGGVSWKYVGTYTPNVTVTKIKYPYRLNINGNFISSSGGGFIINHCVGGSIDIALEGSRSAYGSGIAFNQCADFSAEIRATNLKALLGLLMNDCNNFSVNYYATKVGRIPGDKALRGNGLQQGTINAHFNSSTYSDSIIYGSRNLIVNYNSIGACQVYRDIMTINKDWTPGKAYEVNDVVKSDQLDTKIYICKEPGVSGSAAPTGVGVNISDKGVSTTGCTWDYVARTGNRNEAVQFSECHNIDVTAHIVDANDQCLEFLSCVNVTTYPNRLTNLVGASDGALVIKQNCRSITVNNPVIRDYGNYSIKIEGQYQPKDIFIYNPDTENLSQNGIGLGVRSDGTLPLEFDMNLLVSGGRIKASLPIFIKELHDSITLVNIVLKTIGNTKAIEAQAKKLILKNILISGSTVDFYEKYPNDNKRDGIFKVEF